MPAPPPEAEETRLAATRRAAARASTTAARARAIRTGRAVWGLLAVAVAVEAALSLAELRQGPLPRFGGGRLRLWLWEQGAFWPGLWAGWQPNWPGQRLGMLVSYAFLHDGLGHLAGNAAVILWAAAGFAQRPGFLSARAPALRLAAIWGLAQLGGGLGYGLLHAGPQPMIGASGVAFGLVAALQADLCAGDRAAGDARGAWRRAAGSVLLLGLVNVLSWALLDGRLAWETHLGGALGGLLGWALLAPPAQPSARG